MARGLDPYFRASGVRPAAFSFALSAGRSIALIAVQRAIAAVPAARAAAIAFSWTAVGCTSADCNTFITPLSPAAALDSVGALTLGAPPRPPRPPPPPAAPAAARQRLVVDVPREAMHAGLRRQPLRLPIPIERQRRVGPGIRERRDRVGARVMAHQLAAGVEHLEDDRPRRVGLEEVVD